MFCAVSFAFCPPPGIVMSSENANTYGDAIAVGFASEIPATTQG